MPRRTSVLSRPIKDSLSPIVELVTPIPYVDLQQMFDASAPWGLHSYEKAVYVDDLTDGIIDVIVEHQAKKMSPLSFVPIFNFGGAFRRVDEEATAFGGSRHTGYVINISATTLSPDEFDAERSWVRAYWSALRPHASGQRGLRELHERVRRGSCAQLLRCQVRATAEHQDRLRPGQRLPSQSEHQACVTILTVAAIHIPAPGHADGRHGNGLED